MNSRTYREDVLSALHEATQGFMEAPDKQTVADHAVTTANTVLDRPLNGIWLRSEATDELHLAAATDDGRELIDDPPVYKAGVGLSWEVFEAGEVTIYEDLTEVPDRYNPNGPIQSEIILPLGDHGVMNIGALEPQAFDDVDVSLATILADTITTALDRAEREEELEATIKRLDQFASMVTHDLRNPLSIAIGKLDLYRETGDETHLDDTEKALQRINELTQDLLTLARADFTAPEYQALPISALAQRAWELIDTRSATLNTEECTVMADESQLKALFENLFRNAIGHGGSDVTVRGGPLENGVYVEDTGTGIPPADRDHVFEHGYSTGYVGSGVGLTIVKRIAQAHSWDVTLTESTEGGARFEFRSANNTT